MKFELLKERTYGCGELYSSAKTVIELLGTVKLNATTDELVFKPTKVVDGKVVLA